MEDINALNCKLQDISKTLDGYHAAVMIQDQQILSAKKDAIVSKERIDLLAIQSHDLEIEHNSVNQRNDALKTQTLMLEIDLRCKEAMLISIPSTIRKICVDYEAYSKKKINYIARSLNSLKENQFWNKQISTYNKECASFRNILKEIKQSRGIFRSSEEERIRQELEAEEVELARLELRITELTEKQPTMTSQPVRPVTPPLPPLPPNPPIHKQNAIANPFSDWTERDYSTPYSNASKHTSKRSTREDMFPTYKPCYPKTLCDIHEEEEEEETATDSDGKEVDFSTVRMVASEAVTINTTTVTQKMVRTTLTAATQPQSHPSQFMEVSQEVFENMEEDIWGAEDGSHQLHSQERGVPWFRALKRRRTGVMLPQLTTHQHGQKPQTIIHYPDPENTSKNHDVVDLYACDMSGSDDETVVAQISSVGAGSNNNRGAEENLILSQQSPIPKPILTSLKNRFRTGRDLMMVPSHSGEID